jgi:peptide/nickel transport system ATP-binding protein
MVFQEPGATLDPLFTVSYQISDAIRAHTGMNRSQARDRAVELMRLVWLPDPERRYGYYLHELSGGPEAARRHRQRDRLRPEGHHRR